MNNTTTVNRPVRKIKSAANELSVVEQVRRGFHKKNRLAMACGSILGGFVPAATYVIGHMEVADNPWMWVAVIGGLIYSAKSVYDFATAAFRQPVKALGFVLITEIVMTFSSTQALSMSALALLISINAISAGLNLALERKF